MENWKCPIEHLDEDIRDVVRVLYENGMKPYMSCSGSYKDHQGKSAISVVGCVEMLDSELTREFIASLINDKRFKCSILKENSREFYDNQLPEGFRFKIEFENVCGDVSKDLQSVIQGIIQGIEPKLEDRKKIDAVCELIDIFDVSRGDIITFSFNDELIKPESLEEDNYSITISDKNQHESRFWESDYITMLAVLKKLGMEFKPGQELRCIVDDNRTDKFLSSYSEKIELAKLELENKQNQSLFEPLQDISFDDLLGFFQGEDNNDGER